MKHDKHSQAINHDSIDNLANEYTELLNYLETHEPTDHDTDRLAHIEKILNS